MAVWSYAPNHGMSISFGLPPALITRLDDGKEIRRRKHANAPEAWSETYWFTGAEFDAAYAIALSYGTDLPLTKLGYDLSSNPTVERTVCIDDFELTREGEDFFEVQIRWRRVYS